MSPFPTNCRRGWCIAPTKTRIDPTLKAPTKLASLITDNGQTRTWKIDKLGAKESRQIEYYVAAATAPAGCHRAFSIRSGRRRGRENSHRQGRTARTEIGRQSRNAATQTGESIRARSHHGDQSRHADAAKHRRIRRDARPQPGRRRDGRRPATERSRAVDHARLESEAVADV